MVIVDANTAPKAMTVRGAEGIGVERVVTTVRVAARAVLESLPLLALQLELQLSGLHNIRRGRSARRQKKESESNTKPTIKVTREDRTRQVLTLLYRRVHHHHLSLLRSINQMPSILLPINSHHHPMQDIRLSRHTILLNLLHQMLKFILPTVIPRRKAILRHKVLTLHYQSIHMHRHRLPMVEGEGKRMFKHSPRPVAQSS